MLHSKSDDSFPGLGMKDLRLLARLNEQLQATLNLYLEVRRRVPDTRQLDDDWIVALDRSRSLVSASLSATKLSRRESSIEWPYAPLRRLLCDDDIAWVLDCGCKEQWLILRRQRRMVFLEHAGD